MSSENLIPSDFQVFPGLPQNKGEEKKKEGVRVIEGKEFEDKKF